MEHFLLSAAARTLSLKAVFRMGEDAAYEVFRRMRWPETDGEAVCPKCGYVETYNITSRRRFKCVACHAQFSVTSGTIFTSRKLSYTDLLAAIVIFVNGAKDVSALQVSRDLDVQYKTAFVLSHKLREAGKKVEFVSVPGLDHQLDDDRARTQLLIRSDAFLRAALGM